MLENQRVLQIPIISSRNLQHKHKHHPSYYWIPNREASSPHGYFPIRRPRTEGPTQTVFSPWLLMMDRSLALWMELLCTQNLITSFIGCLENIALPSHAEFPNVDALHIQHLKTSHCLSHQKTKSLLIGKLSSSWWKVKVIQKFYFFPSRFTFYH